jgi:hypothetical protein
MTQHTSRLHKGYLTKESEGVLQPGEAGWENAKSVQAVKATGGYFEHSFWLLQDSIGVIS